MLISILKLAAGPVIGAVIGYFTNLIAVKMLFYPHKAVKLFGKTLPFTPGVIPKGKPRLAKAIGKAVSENLITKEDLEKRFLSDDIVKSIASDITQKLNSPVKQSVMDLTNLSEDLYNNGKNMLSEILTDEIVKALSSLNYSVLLKEKAVPVIMNSISNPMVRMLINEDLINSFVEPLGDNLKAMILSDGNTFIKPMVFKKLNEFDAKSTVEHLSKINISEQILNSVIASVLKSAISNGVSRILDKIDIKYMVEDKINGMDIDELEKLILEVMKKELNAIVNLGAVIGLILGFVNMMIAVLS